MNTAFESRTNPSFAGRTETPAENGQNKMVYFTDILQSIQEIVNNTKYVESAIAQVSELNVEEDTQTAIDTINCLVTIVQCRETTNQKALQVLEKLGLATIGEKAADPASDSF